MLPNIPNYQRPIRMRRLRLYYISFSSPCIGLDHALSLHSD